jgi:hypothetical protein
MDSNNPPLPRSVAEGWFGGINTAKTESGSKSSRVLFPNYTVSLGVHANDGDLYRTAVIKEELVAAGSLATTSADPVILHLT